MISIVYGCMNREQNLLESIQSWLTVPEINEFIIVDWSSTKPLIENNIIKNLVDSKKIKLIRVCEEKFFSLAKAYNLGISIATNKIILKCDCDYKNINPSWIKNLSLTEDNELKNYFIVGNWKFAGPLNGFLLTNKKDFAYYNENFNGYGYDDDDLYKRMLSQSQNKYLNKIIFFNIKDYIYHIPHDEQERTKNYEIKDRLESNEANRSMADKPFTLSLYKTINLTENYMELKRI